MVSTENPGYEEEMRGESAIAIDGRADTIRVCMRWDEDDAVEGDNDKHKRGIVKCEVCEGMEGRRVQWMRNRGDDKCQIITTRNKNANGDGLSDRRLGVGLCQSRDRETEPQQE